MHLSWCLTFFHIFILVATKAGFLDEGLVTFNNNDFPDLIEPALDWSTSAGAPTDSLNTDDTLALSNPNSVDEPSLFDDPGSDSDFLLAGGSMDECSLTRSSSRRRRRRSEGEETCGEPIHRDFSYVVSERLTPFDKDHCDDDLPFLICSSINPSNTHWVPGLASSVLFNSARGAFEALHFYFNFTFAGYERYEN